MAGFYAFHEVVIGGGGVDEVDACLVDGEEVRGGEDADIGNGRLGGGDARAIAIDGHAAEHVEVDDVFPKIIDGGFGGFGHVFHQGFFRRPYIPVFGDVIGGNAVHLAFSDASVGATDGEIFHGAAEAAHGVAFEVGEDDHGVVIDDVSAHGNFFEVVPAADGKGDGAFFVHDVDGAECPAVHGEGLAVELCGVAVAFVEGIRFHNGAFGNCFLKRFDHVARQNVRAVLFAGVEFNGGFAVDGVVDFPIEGNEVRGVDVSREINFGVGVGRVRGDAPAADNGCLCKCFHSFLLLNYYLYIYFKHRRRLFPILIFYADVCIGGMRGEGVEI